MFESRDFNGYYQSREVVKDGDRTIHHQWRFYICSFAKDTASILRFDKTQEAVPIDAANRILVGGRWFSARHWDH